MKNEVMKNSKIKFFITFIESHKSLWNHPNPLEVLENIVNNNKCYLPKYLHSLFKVYRRVVTTDPEIRV